MDNGETQKPKSSAASWLVLLAVVFLTIASLSALIAWAQAQKDDTSARRALQIPQTTLSVASSAMEHAVRGVPALPEPISVDSVPTPEIKTGDNAPEAEPLPEPAVTADPESAPAPLPDPALLQPTEQGAIPTIAEGRTSWKTYAARYNREDTRPRIAIIIGDMGLRRSITDKAIAALPPLTTLAFSPYGTDLKASMQRARGKNQEVLLELPLEPFYYPINDSGPQSLLVNNPTEENMKRLQWVMAQGEAYVGLIAGMGGKFLTVDSSMRLLLTEVKKRGLIFVDNLSAINSLTQKISTETKTPTAAATVIIDADPSKANIEAKLKQLEDQAKSAGYAVGLGHGLPVTIDSVAQWSQNLTARGFNLVPITALVDVGKK